MISHFRLPEVLTDEDIEPVFLIPKGRSLDAARIEVVGSPEFKVSLTSNDFLQGPSLSNLFIGTMDSDPECGRR